MRKLKIGFIALALSLAMITSGHAFFLNFETGTEGAEVVDITGVSFLDFNGYHALYGDSRTGTYNTTSDDLGYGGGIYHHNGNFFVWAGPNADARGMIVDFTSNDGTFFTTGYSAYSNFFIDAYLTDGSMITAMGAANTGSPMGYLSVFASAGNFIDYIVLHDTGNYWLVDDMSGDASGVAPVPEPGTFVLLGLGLTGLALVARRNKKEA